LHEVKPLPWSFIASLPLVVVAIWLVFLAVAHAERSELIARLTEQVVHGSVDDATLALRQMARLSDPPLELLVAMSAAPTREVAAEAQRAVTSLLRQWQRELTAGGDADEIANRLLQLAEMLDRHRDAFAATDFPWLDKTVQRIVRLSHQTPADRTAGLAAHCDTLLTLVAAAPSGTIAVREPAIVASRPAAMSTVFDDAGQTVQEIGLAPRLSPVESAALTPVAEDVLVPIPRSALESILPPDAATDDQPDDAEPDTASPDGAPSAWQPRWTQPAKGPVPAGSPPTQFAQQTQPAVKSASPIPVVDPQSATADAADRWEAVGTRELLERWRSDDGSGGESLRVELARRGFGAIWPDLVRPLLSADPRDRRQLVDDVLRTPGIDAKAWLMLLAEDADADVRLAAVTVMSTSSDPQLIEKAWQVALNDRDPRVASLVERLRAHRASGGRR